MIPKRAVVCYQRLRGGGPRGVESGDSDLTNVEGRYIIDLDVAQLCSR